MKRFLETGKIVTTHGVRGEVKVYPWCDDPQMLCELDTLYLKDETPLSCEKARLQNGMVLLKFAGVDTLDQAAQLRGKILFLDRNDLELPQGTYFIQDLLGLRVLDQDSGQEYGRITDVLETGANDVYQITDTAGTPRLIPAIPDVVMGVDLEAGEVRIRPLKGLFDDEN